MSKFNDLINGEIPVLLDIYANWCAPCKVLSPILKEIKSDFKESLIILKIDIEGVDWWCIKEILQSNTWYDELPDFFSVEVFAVEWIMQWWELAFAHGYTHYKLVEQ